MRFGVRYCARVRALEHSGGSFDSGCIERDHPVARLVLAAPDVQEALHENDVAPAQVLDCAETIKSDGESS